MLGQHLRRALERSCVGVRGAEQKPLWRRVGGLWWCSMAGGLVMGMTLERAGGMEVLKAAVDKEGVSPSLVTDRLAPGFYSLVSSFRRLRKQVIQVRLSTFPTDHARLPPAGVQCWRACPHAQPGCITRGAPSAAVRQLHLLTYPTAHRTSLRRGFTLALVGGCMRDVKRSAHTNNTGLKANGGGGGWMGLAGGRRRRRRRRRSW